MQNVINSTANRQMKQIVKLLTKSKERREQQCFVAEGIRMFMETPATRIVKVYVSESFYEQEKNRKLLEKKQVEYEVVADRVFDSISDTVTPQGVLVLVRIREITLEQLLNHRKKKLTENPQQSFTYLVLENLQDPGNLGTMLRTAEGAGVAGIIATRTTVDLYNPKVIRSTMGSVYRMPYIVVDDLSAAVQQMQAEGITVYAAHMNDSLSYDEADYTKDTAFLIGNEGNGLTDEISNLADSYLHIPMAGKVESLNASMAAGILMYEAARQKRKAF